MERDNSKMYTPLTTAQKYSVMQISISERTCEIGLRKAIGANDPGIFGQFLIGNEATIAESVAYGFRVRS